MDVAYYISELLVQHGEVNVPGLGCFNAVRQDGYYNENEATFYPPRNIVKFDKACVDDGLFYTHIAKKKNISLASSKYFTEKYINRLKEHALSKDVTLSDLGWLHLDGDDISFRPVGALPNDGTFYGYPQIKLNKYVEPEHKEVIAPISEYIASELQDEPTHQYVQEPFMIEPALYEPQAYQSATANNPVQVINQKAAEEELIDEDEDLVGKDRSRTTTYVRVVIALLIVALLFALIVFGLYKYDPALFVEKNTPAIAAVKHDSVKATTPTTEADTSTKTAVDTAKAAPTVKPDTTTQKTTVTTTAPVTAVNDTLTQIHYELLGGAFGTEAEANEAIGNYKRLGIEAHILRNVPGKLYKVTLGTFFTDKDAINAKNTLVSTKKISEGNIIVQPFHPRKIKL